MKMAESSPNMKKTQWGKGEIARYKQFLLPPPPPGLVWDRIKDLAKEAF